MTVTIKKLADTEHQFLAYATTFASRATYFVSFEDNIWGAMVLHHFVDMIRVVFPSTPVELALSEHDLVIKNPAVLELLRDPSVHRTRPNNPASGSGRKQSAQS